MQLRRVEVEVHPDWLEALEPIVEQLRVSCGLQPARLSKFEAGLLALGEEVPGTPELGPTEVSASSTMGEIAFAVAAAPARRVRDKEPGTRLGEDPEELHDMRVATRRLRAALSLFEGVLPVRAQVSGRSSGGWPGLLGAVRDLDVQLESLADMSFSDADWPSVPTPRRRPPGRPGGRSSSVSARRAAPTCCRGLTRSAGIAWPRDSPSWRSRDPHGAPSPPGSRPPSACRTRAAATEGDQGRQAGQAVRGGDRLPRARIRCKRLRYALEFSSDVYGGRRPASCARSPCCRTSSAKCRTPRWPR